MRLVPEQILFNGARTGVFSFGGVLHIRSGIVVHLARLTHLGIGHPGIVRAMWVTGWGVGYGVGYTDKMDLESSILDFPSAR